MPSRSSAGTVTSPTTRSSATCVRRRCCRSWRGPTRSSAWSWPGRSASGDVTGPDPDAAVPREEDLRRVKLRLAPLRGLADGVLATDRAGDDHILVLKRGDQVLLYFGTPRPDGRGMDFSGVMSRVSLGDPMFLLGLYTRVMMLTLAWCPQPRVVCAVGFGGGRIPMV